MKPQQINIDFRQPQVMAILNVTPDSFYADSRMFSAEALRSRVEECVAQGATIIDIGGYSSRPGAAEVPADEEWRRVAEGLETVRSISPTMAVSVDTFRSEIVERVVERFGAVIVNDISAGELDSEMVRTVARYELPYIAMHMRGTPATMQSLTDYTDVTAEVVDFFRAKTSQFEGAGIRRDNLILDPGFGFSKTTEQNFELLRGLHCLCELGYPVLSGVSRKSMIWRTLDCTPADALASTIALGWESLRQGATILRVHDVREAADTIKIFNAYKI